MIKDLTEDELNFIDTLVRAYDNSSYILLSNNQITDEAYEQIYNLCKQISKKIEGWLWNKQQ